MIIISATINLLLLLTLSAFAQELTIDGIAELVFKDLKNKSWTNIPKFNTNSNEAVSKQSKNSF